MRPMMKSMTTFLDLFSQSSRPTVKLDSYCGAYDELFAPYRGRDITFVEVGISGGGSLEVWRRFLGSRARVIGIDLNPALKDVLERDGYEIFIGDQADPAFWKTFYAKVGNVDVLLDDGGHTNAQTWGTLVSSIDHINDGGLLVVEDTHASYMREFGNPSRRSLVSRIFGCVDEINYRSSVIPSRDRYAWRRLDLVEKEVVARNVYSIRFYQSLIALSIDSTRCGPSELVRYGSAANLPGGIHPEDYRLRGIGEPLASRIRRRAWTLAHRVRSAILSSSSSREQ